MEDSAVAWKNYLYVTDNGGKLFCWDLNTMKLVWVQNVLDDTNTSPVFEEENGHGYIYISTSLHITAKTTADRPQGRHPHLEDRRGHRRDRLEDRSVPVLHGARTSPAGCRTPRCWARRTSPIWSSTPSPARPTRAAASWWLSTRRPAKRCGRRSFNHYTWSSPVAVYTPEGKSYIVPCDTVGNMFLLEGKTGKIVDYINLGTNIEASPAVFGNTIVVGTRGQKIYAVKIN